MFSSALQTRKPEFFGRIRVAVTGGIDRNIPLSIVLLMLLFMMTSPIAAQRVSSQDQSVSLKQLRQLRRQTEKNRLLSKEARSRILKLCDDADESLRKAIDNRRSAAAFERERGGIESRVRALQADLAAPEQRPRLGLPKNASVSAAEDALARERSRLAANRLALRDLERLAEDRAKSRAEISGRLGELDLELELLDDELRSVGDSIGPIEVKSARRLNVLARREAALSEIDMLRAKLGLLGDRSVLTPMRIDLSKRRVALSEELVRMATKAAHDLRETQARESLKRIESLSRQLSRELPMLLSLATETGNLAQALWGENGFITRSELTVRALAETRRRQSELSRIAELTTRKYEAYGGRGSITRWWPRIPKDFPKPGEVARTLRRLEEEIPEVEYQLITFEQERSTAHDLLRNTMRNLDVEFGDQPDPDLVRRVHELLSTRQDLLDRLIREGGRYSNQLAEYQTVSRKFLDRLGEIQRFLFAHVLWARSVPKPIIPQLSSVVDAARWLISTEHLDSVSITAFDFRGDGLFEALLLIALVFLRQPMRSRLRDIGERISNADRDGFRFTLEALVITCLLALPLALAFHIIGPIIGRLGNSVYYFSMGKAMSELAWVAALFELTRQIFSPKGLAEAHFGWPAQATRPLYRGLVLTSLIGLPLLYVSLHLGFAGVRMDSPEQLQLFSNSLGRLAFVAALIFFGFSILAMLKPEKNLEPSHQDVRVPWPRRFSEYAFPAAFLGAYPVVILATIVPAVLAVFGFYITALLLAYQMLRTLLLGILVLVTGGLLHRWWLINRNQLLLEGAGGGEILQPTPEMSASDKQTRQLFRFIVITILSVGLFGIWSDALPWIQVLKRVQILPRIELLHPPEGSRSPSLTAGETFEENAPTRESSITLDAAPGSQIPGSGIKENSVPATGNTDQSPLTVWEILEAILAGLFTLLLVKNLPGIIDIILRRRTTLDRGARFAFSTLVRYSITIFGSIAVFGLLGVTWGKVQWLAAALTFGLGFGLQEIVANFVSGLILLVERPVRVGDVVTIGTLMGRVNRIQIRATTITLWDRSEMIVPNKEFITTKLVNWTLSDSKRRIEISLRVAYGTDLEEVRNILVEIAEQHPAVLKDPAPHVLLLAFGEDAINFELRFVVDFGQGLTTKDQVQMAIEGAFREKGIEFALPRSEVRLISDGSEPR